MKLLLHDLAEQEFEALFPNLSPEYRVVSRKTKEIKKCVGCFGCWLKTPGTCIIRDGYGDLARQMGEAEEYILLTQITYGGYSPFVKNILDRNIGYLLPFFTMRDHGGKKEIHHKIRYGNRFRLTVLGYGEAAAEERETFRGLAAANGLNMNVRDVRVLFASTPKDFAENREVFA